MRRRSRVRKTCRTPNHVRPQPSHAARRQRMAAIWASLVVVLWISGLMGPRGNNARRICAYMLSHGRSHFISEMCSPTARAIRPGTVRMIKSTAKTSFIHRALNRGADATTGVSAPKCILTLRCVGRSHGKSALYGVELCSKAHDEPPAAEYAQRWMRS